MISPVSAGRPIRKYMVLQFRSTLNKKPATRQNRRGFNRTRRGRKNNPQADDLNAGRVSLWWPVLISGLSRPRQQLLPVRDGSANHKNCSRRISLRIHHTAGLLFSWTNTTSGLALDSVALVMTPVFQNHKCSSGLSRLPTLALPISRRTLNHPITHACSGRSFPAVIPA